MTKSKDPEQERAEIREEVAKETGSKEEEHLDDARGAPPGFMGRVLRDDHDRTGISED